MVISSPAEAQTHQDVSVIAMADLAAPAIRVSWNPLIKNALRIVGRVLAAVAFVSAVTFVFVRVLPLNATTAGFLYLVAILTIATVGGLVESTIASIVAMLCFNFFFLPPVGTFTIADPQNWVALF